MNSKPLLIVLSVFLALALLAGSCAAGFVAGSSMGLFTSNPAAVLPILQGFSSTQQSSSASEAGTPQNVQELFKPFWQAWDLVNQSYVDQPVDQTALMRGAIKGMLESLGDEHTSYLDPEQYTEANVHLQGEEYEGIGAWVDVTGDYLKIISPMPDSPAEKAGLKPGDKVVAIDGEDMTGKDGEYARQHVLGPKGSIVTLTILREGAGQPFDVKVERAAITVPTVAGKMLDNNIAYVQLFVFGDSTAADLKKTLSGLMDQNPQGLILDLRNNGGGYLVTAIDVASQFIGDGKIMYEQYGDGRREEYDARSGGLATKIPMVVLVNEGTASASEIVSGAIQDRGRGYLVGVKTYGKGSVQNYTELVNQQGAVRVTIARWLTPDGRQINGVGLQPNFPVEITQEDVNADRDPQLQKAIDVLLQNLTPPPTPVVSPTPAATPTP
jgi:carboxyl-terminal processing protease